MGAARAHTTRVAPAGKSQDRLLASAEPGADRGTHGAACAGDCVSYPVPRLALTRAEAAWSLSMSLDSFERHVQPDLQLVRVGRLVRVPRQELERWVERNAAPTLPSEAA